MELIQKIRVLQIEKRGSSVCSAKKQYMTIRRKRQR